MKNDLTEVTSLYDNPEYASTVADLKKQLAALRKKVSDTGEDFPQLENIVQEFWDYDASDRAKAEELSTSYLNTRLGELADKKKKTKHQKK